MRTNLGLGIALPRGGFLPLAISFAGSSVLDNATVGTVVGTASVPASVTGTPVWSLANSAGGKYAINSSTGVVTVAAALTAGVDSITISVTGVAPALANQPFGIVVNSSATSNLLADVGSPILADTGSPILVQ